MPFAVDQQTGGRLADPGRAERKALNEVMRETYLAEIGAVVAGWNRCSPR